MSCSGAARVCINKVCKAVAAALENNHTVDMTDTHKLLYSSCRPIACKLSMAQTSENSSQVTAECLATAAFEGVQPCCTELDKSIAWCAALSSKRMLDIAQIEQLSSRMKRARCSWYSLGWPTKGSSGRSSCLFIVCHSDGLVLFVPKL